MFLGISNGVEKRGQNVGLPLILLGLGLWLAPSPAAAQKDPEFEFQKAKDLEKAEWKAQAKAGVVATTGNSQTSSVTLGGSVSRKKSKNKFALDVGMAYARSNILVAEDQDSSGAIEESELFRREETTANSWFSKLRYDRFFTTNNSAYLAGLAGADEPAGKDFAGGGQIGYSRQLFTTDNTQSHAELGYDFTYEDYSGEADESVSIHSARVFLGNTTKLTDDTSFFLNIEALFNLNEEKVPNANDKGKDKVGAFRDTRLLGKAGIATLLWKKLSFNFTFTAKYDHNPAPRPTIGDAPAYADGFMPFADKLDTISEAALVFSFF